MKNMANTKNCAKKKCGNLDKKSFDKNDPNRVIAVGEARDPAGNLNPEILPLNVPSNSA